MEVISTGRVVPTLSMLPTLADPEEMVGAIGAIGIAGTSGAVGGMGLAGGYVRRPLPLVDDDLPRPRPRPREDVVILIWGVVGGRDVEDIGFSLQSLMLAASGSPFCSQTRVVWTCAKKGKGWQRMAEDDVLCYIYWTGWAN